MKESIQSFIDQKDLRPNSRQAYAYDLLQFWEQVGPTIDSQSLLTYQQGLAGLKPSAQKRKVSAVNQFLYYLYERGDLLRFYKISLSAQRTVSKPKVRPADLSVLWQETPHKEGQLIALLISQLGLTPSELAQIRSEQIDREFRIVQLEKQGQKRVLSLPKSLLSYLEPYLGAVFLFDKKGQAYSRQWFFNQLSHYVSQLGHPTWTAQWLREQYMVHQLAAGQSLDDLAKHLGLKTRTTLEKYR